MKFPTYFLISFLFLLFPKDSNEQDLFQSLDFARNTLMQFSRGITRVVQVLIPIEAVAESPSLSVQPKPTTKAASGGTFGVYFGWITNKVKKVVKYVGGFVNTVANQANRIPGWKYLKSTITFTEETRVYVARASPSNTFLIALNRIEHALAEARAAARKPRSFDQELDKLKRYIKLGARRRSYDFAWRAVGQALYLLEQKGVKRSREKRSTLIAARNEGRRFMSNLKREMGSVEFDKLMAVQEDVTLMFAIDVSGSMNEEIESAKQIAIYVINHPRLNTSLVNYILSPFNDPEVGPVTENNERDALGFAQGIQALQAKGGGDCPELTFAGIKEALCRGPRVNSPMYVFTDASAKDATEENMEMVESLARCDGVRIYFFLTGSCQGTASYRTPDEFQRVAEATGGQVIHLSKVGELQQLSNITASDLAGTNSICFGTNYSRRKKRSASGNQHSIVLDDSIDEVTFSITTETANTAVSLKDPNDVVITSGKTALSWINMYLIKNPTAGTWVLTIPSSAGKSSFFVKGSSATNIDFEHSFFMRRTRGKAVEEVPTSHPVIGKSTQVLITVAGAEKVRPRSLRLEFITKHGDHISSHRLQSRGSMQSHYLSTFTSPADPFWLKLTGTTTTGKAFERISRNIVSPQTVILRIVYARNHYTLSTGKTGFLLFEIINGLPTRETFKIKANSWLGNVRQLNERSKNTQVRGRHRASFFIRLKSPKISDIGKTDIVKVSVTGRGQKPAKSVQIVKLLVVQS